MSLVLTERGQRMMDALPQYYCADPAVLEVINAVAREYDRVEELLTALREGSLPTLADDAYRLLALWETIYGLPVEPEGVGLATRRANLLATIRSRRSSTGSDWVTAVNTAIGTSWTHDENTPGGYQLSIGIPFSAGSYDAGRVEELLAQITPAHLEIVMRYNEGFIVGVARVGDAI